VSAGTIKTHVKAILRKLQAVSRTEAIAIAHERGILSRDGLGRAGTRTLRKPTTRPVAAESSAE